MEPPGLPPAAPARLPPRWSCPSLLLNCLRGRSIPELTAPLPPSAPPLLPTAGVPLGVPLGRPADTRVLCSLAGSGAAGLDLQTGLPEPCLQHLRHFPSLALHSLSNPLRMAEGLAPPRQHPSEHGQRPGGKMATCWARAQL